MTDHYANSKVINVTAKDFDSSFNLKKKPSKAGLIVFHATWCGFCVQLSPEYKKVAAKAGVKLYSIDADLEGSKEVFAHFKVSGFPTIRFMSKNGKVGSESYMEERDAATMMKYIKDKSTSGGAKKKVAKKGKKAAKKVAKKCSGKACKGKCTGGKCKAAKKCVGKKCKGKCHGGKCKAQKGGNLKKDIVKSLKKVKKVVKKTLKKAKKMVGGKKKARKPSAYNKHVSAEMKKGKSMKQAAASWKLKK